MILIANFVFNVKLTGRSWLDHWSIILPIHAFITWNLCWYFILLIHWINLHAYNLNLCTRFALWFLVMWFLVILRLRLLLWRQLFLHWIMPFLVFFVLILIILKLIYVLSLTQKEWRLQLVYQATCLNLMTWTKLYTFQISCKTLWIALFIVQRQSRISILWLSFSLLSSNIFETGVLTA